MEFLKVCVVLSIIEFMVIGGVAYFTLFLVISTIVKENRIHVSQFDRSSARAMFVLPGLICMGVVSTFGVAIDFPAESVIVTNGTGHVTETTEKNTVNTLKSSVWFPVHSMFVLILLMYFLFQIMDFVTKSHR